MKKPFIKYLITTSNQTIFSVKDEYDRVAFIVWVDRRKADFHLKDSLVNRKPNQVLICIPEIWFIEPRREELLFWEGCKGVVIHRFKTEIWKKKVCRQPVTWTGLASDKHRTSSMAVWTQRKTTST